MMRSGSPVSGNQLKRASDSQAEPSRTSKFAKAHPHEDRSEGVVSQIENMGSQRYLVALEYAGTRFSGSQKQLNCRTVEGVLEDAFHKFVGQPVSIAFSSRTDVGVHALSNVFHVDIERRSKRKPGEVLAPHDPGVVRRAVNHFLQKNEGDTMLLDVRCVPATFHARFNAIERTYYYRILSGLEPLSIFEKERAWHISEELDLVSMQKACSLLIGQHDFSSFRSASCQAKSPVKTLDELHVCEVPPSSCIPLNFESDAEYFGHRRKYSYYIITARARSFLYHQVRLLVGLLKSVGIGDLKIEDVQSILDAKSVSQAPPMAPACGLYLASVKYNFPPEENKE